jgi:glutamate dehydrogenase
MAIINITDDWLDKVRASLGARADLVDRLEPAMPAGYDELNDPTVAALDFVKIDALARGPEDLTTELLQRPDGSWRFRIYRRGDSIPLADMLPLLDHLGLRALDERAFGFGINGSTVWLHDVGVSVPADVQLTDAIRNEVQRGFLAEFIGSVEVDGLNRLVMLGGLTARQIEILRAYSRYLRQIGFPFGQQYIESTLVRHASISRLLAALFAARFDPLAVEDIVETEPALRAEIDEALDAVPSLDDDRTLRSLLTLIDATVRTNAFRPADDGGVRPVLSYKFDTSKIPDLPLPRPMFEIWVCSPRVEGVHMRNGRIARGGIRWSDRREDFRTEILGLVKAQIVKNAVIVPTGAKGGFVLKKPPSGAEEFRAEGVACYREFISGLLDITDNIVAGAIVPPPDTIRLDGDDPYLVVAADKGTATFSDIANEISAHYGFWLGDARSPRAAATGTTTKPWGSRPAGPGRACAGTPVCWGRTPTPMSSPSSASATCPVMFSATGCCAHNT